MTTILSDDKLRERLLALADKFVKDYLDQVVHRSVEMEKAAEQWRRLQPSLRTAVRQAIEQSTSHSMYGDALVTDAAKVAIALLDAASVQVP